jgi:hypothetical protein
VSERVLSKSILSLLENQGTKAVSPWMAAHATKITAPAHKFFPGDRKKTKFPGALISEAPSDRPIRQQLFAGGCRGIIRQHLQKSQQGQRRKNFTRVNRECGTRKAE